MARPTLEYTRIDSFTLAVGGLASIPMIGPVLGTKGVVTALIKGTGATSPSLDVTVRSGSVTKAVFSKNGSLNISSNFVELWYGYAVPIDSASMLRILGGAGISGSVEIAYWDAETIASLLAAGPHTGLVGGYPPPGFAIPAVTNNDLVYGAVMANNGTADWTPAGGPTMEVIWPSYATLPPEFSNDQTVMVGTAFGSPAVKAAVGFVREPIAAGVPLAFDFSVSSTWSTYWWRLTGTPTLAVASQLVTILG